MTADRAQLAARLYADRRDRDEVFGGASAGFGEPAWDMLLQLYVFEAAGRRCTSADLISAAGVEAALAAPFLRWLTTYGLIRVSAGIGPEDAEVQFEPVGRTRLEAFLDRRRMENTER